MDSWEKEKLKKELSQLNALLAFGMGDVNELRLGPMRHNFSFEDVRYRHPIADKLRNKINEEKDLTFEEARARIEEIKKELTR